VNAVTFSPDGSRLYAASADRRVHRWDLTGGAPTSTVIAEHGGPVNALSISADGTLLAAGGDDQIVRIMAISGDDVQEVTQLHGHSSTVRSVSFDPTSRLLATGADDQTVRLWALDDPAAPSAIGETLVPSGVVRWRVAFSPTGALGGGGENGVLGWWTTDVDTSADRICAATHGTELDGELAQWSDEAAEACAP
jgi:WD40 repeat protein